MLGEYRSHHRGHALAWIRGSRAAACRSAGLHAVKSAGLQSEEERMLYVTTRTRERSAMMAWLCNRFNRTARRSKCLMDSQRDPKLCFSGKYRNMSKRNYSWAVTCSCMGNLFTRTSPFPFVEDWIPTVQRVYYICRVFRASTLLFCAFPTNDVCTEEKSKRA